MSERAEQLEVNAVLRIIARELGLATTAEEPSELLAAVLARCREAVAGDSARQATASPGGPLATPLSTPASRWTDVGTARPSALTGRQREWAYEHFQRALEAERARSEALEARVARLTRDGVELRALLCALAEAEAEARSEVLHLRAVVCSTEAGLQATESPDSAGESVPKDGGRGAAVLVSPLPTSNLDELVASLHQARSRLLPLSEKTGWAAPTLPLELSDDELEEESGGAANDEAAGDAERALAAAEGEASRLAAQAHSLRTDADAQAANAAFAIEAARGTAEAAGAATLALADKLRDPSATRSLTAQQHRADEDAARADGLAREAVDLACRAALAAADAADAAAFARATADARAFAFAQGAAKQRRIVDYSARRASLQAQRSKLAAALREERVECEAACREVAGLIEVLKAHGKAPSEVAAAAAEMAVMERGDRDPDFPQLLQPSSSKPLDILRSIALERDRLTRRLAAVTRRHDAATQLQQTLAVHLHRLQAAHGGELQAERQRVLPGAFERVLAALT